MESGGPSRFRFQAFDLDADSGELRQGETKLRVTDQSIQILTMLLRQAGRVVTREELKAALWPDNTIVEFDHSINTGVNRLRLALGDSAENPRFIETLPRRGYRFIARVEAVGQPAGPAEEAVGGLPQPGSKRRNDGWLWTGALTIVFLAAGGIYLLLLPKAGPDPPPQVIPLTASLGSVSGPAFSPDGNLIAYAWQRPGEDHGDIYVRQVDGTTALRVTKEPTDHFKPTFSPDGGYIAHFHNGKLMVIPTFGGPERKIADLDCGDCFPWIDYAPDGKAVAVCERVNGVESIVMISMDTGAKRRLTTPPPGLKDLGLRFSPDGQRMAVARGVAQIMSDIYVMPANGGEIKRLTNENGFHHDLAWTADSREIIFDSGYRENGSLRRVGATGGIPQPMAGASIGATEPAASRSGHRLAFVSAERQQSIWRLELLQPGNRAGESSKLIASPRGNSSPDYSPDGRKIAFTSGRSGAPEIWVANADGSEPLQLTAFRGPVTGSPTWSPDGRRIAFDSWPGGNGDIWLMNVDGGSLHRITTNAAIDFAPYWSGVFTQTEKEEQNVLLVNNCR